MDLFAHIAYGVTAFSRSGFAGGRRGSAHRWYRDRTVALAGVFGFLPDLLSMGAPFFLWLATGAPGNFFGDFDPAWLTAYRASHSLVTAAALIVLIAVFRRSLLIPALAYPLHVICDALTHHDSGTFHAPLFYPMSEWVLNGVPWWRHTWVVTLYWSLLITAWIILLLIRRSYRSRDGGRKRLRDIESTNP